MPWKRPKRRNRVDIKYPKIKVRLTGQDGNAFMVLGLVRRAMKKAGLSQEEIKAFMDEATSGNYDHLLQTAMQWVDVK
jgi:hypothetical protein